MLETDMPDVVSISRNLRIKYKPKSFDEFLGQPAAVGIMKAWLENPCSEMFLFDGIRGSGKTTLAGIVESHLRELFGEGFWLTEASGNSCGIDLLDKTFVKMREGRAYRQVRHGVDETQREWFGSTCDVLRIDQCEQLSMAERQRVQAFYDRMEEFEKLNKICVLIFCTTGMTNDLRREFRSRFQHVKFESKRSVLEPAALQLINHIWKCESFPGDPPSLERLGLGRDATLSFRDIPEAIKQFVSKGEAAAVAEAKAPAPSAVRAFIMREDILELNSVARSKDDSVNSISTQAFELIQVDGAWDRLSSKTSIFGNSKVKIPRNRGSFIAYCKQAAPWCERRTRAEWLQKASEGL